MTGQLCVVGAWQYEIISRARASDVRHRSRGRLPTGEAAWSGQIRLAMNLSFCNGLRMLSRIVARPASQ